MQSRKEEIKQQFKSFVEETENLTLVESTISFDAETGGIIVGFEFKNSWSLILEAPAGVHAVKKVTIIKLLEESVESFEVLDQELWDLTKLVELLKVKLINQQRWLKDLFNVLQSTAFWIPGSPKKPLWVKALSENPSNHPNIQSLTIHNEED